MELLITASHQLRPREVIDLAVNASDTATVADLIAHLGHKLAAAEPGTPTSLYVPRLGASLVSAQPLRESDLVSGDAVELRTGRPDSSPGITAGLATVRLDMLSGPQAGQSVSLHVGDHTIGTDQSCSISIGDTAPGQIYGAIRVRDGVVLVRPNPRSDIPTKVDGQPIDCVHRINSLATITMAHTSFSVRPIVRATASERDIIGQIAHNRAPFRPHLAEEVDIGTAPPLPAAPEARRFSVFAVLGPLVASVAMAVFTGRWAFLLIAAASPIVGVLQRWDDRRHGDKKYKSEVAAFEAAVSDLCVEMERAQSQERQALLTAYPDASSLSEVAELRTRRLWERGRDDACFGQLRLGLGSEPSSISAEVGGAKDHALAVMASDRIASYELVHSVPSTVRLNEVDHVAIVGTDPWPTTRSLLAQMATLHSPEDLVILATAADIDQIDWMKWLPHTRSSASPISGSHLAVVGPSAAQLHRELLAVCEARASQAQVSAWPRLLIVIDENAELDRPSLARLMALEGSGTHVLWVGTKTDLVPRSCRATLTIGDDAPAGVIVPTDPRVSPRSLHVEGVGLESAENLARSLAPVRDASADDTTSAIPRRVDLFGALVLRGDITSEIQRRWVTNREYCLLAQIGTSAEGPVELDLVAHGPHALIAGTSGAGKSELLQSLVCGLAANHPPDRVNFLFIDYKGGASSAMFEPLPHTVGSVTNLDPAMAMRALASLRAEVAHRMRVMEGRAKDLAEMLEKFPDEAPPSLVLVCDEFATLVKEVPDFVAGIVDIAQRGRSLGVHLILATQRPAGSVNDNILANTNLRICLRVLDPADSSSIIGKGDAAAIPNPLKGRAFLKTGPGDLIQFQSAWSGAPLVAYESTAPVTSRRFALLGSDLPDSPKASGGDEGTPQTHLDHLVESIVGLHRDLELPEPRKPWVAPLPALVTLSSARGQFGRPRVADAGREVVIGLSDQPQLQSQALASVDLERLGGLLIFGGGGAGKTTALRTVAASAIEGASPAEVQLMVWDLGSRLLTQLEDLPHTVAALTADMPEALCRAIQYLEAQVVERRALLASRRAESLTSLRSTIDGPGVPRLLLLIDNYGALAPLFEELKATEWLGRLVRAVADGRQVGIHLIATAERRAAIPAQLMSTVSGRLILRLAEADELAALGVPKDQRDRAFGDGRGLLNGSEEVQVASISTDPSAKGQAEEIARLVELSSGPAWERAPGLDELPDRAEVIATPSAGGLATIGVAEGSAGNLQIDVAGGLLIVGEPETGKSHTLAMIAEQLVDRPGVTTLGLGSAASPLAGRHDLFDVQAFVRSGQVDAVASFAQEITSSTALALVIIDSCEDIDPTAERDLERLLGFEQIALLAAASPALTSRPMLGWKAALKRTRNALLFAPESRGQLDAVLGVRPELRPAQPFPTGRAVLVKDRRPFLIQVAASVATDEVKTNTTPPLAVNN